MQPNKFKSKNPVKNGQKTRCSTCQSINNETSQCPDNEASQGSCLVNESVTSK